MTVEEDHPPLGSRTDNSLGSLSSEEFTGVLCVLDCSIAINS